MNFTHIRVDQTIQMYPNAICYFQLFVCNSVYIVLQHIPLHLFSYFVDATVGRKQWPINLR